MSAEKDCRQAIDLAIAKGARCPAEFLAPLRAMPLLALVTAMQPELTSTVPKALPIAIHVLAAAAVERTEPVPADALRVLFAFFASKVNHFSTLDAAVEATSTVFVWHVAHNRGATLVEDVLREVVANVLGRVQIQNMFGASKAAAFGALVTLADPGVTDCFTPEVAKAFLSAYLAAVDGEREPEMVLTVFQTTQLILCTFSAAQLSFFLDDFFMSASNYFPVLFTPPANCKVTKSQLKEALVELLSLPIFHEQCIPFAVGKLSSLSAVAKADTLQLLLGLVEGRAYPPTLLQPHIQPLLSALRGEGVKLAQVLSINDGASDLMQALLGLVGAIGALLDATQSHPDEIRLLADPLLSSTLSIVETGSNASASAMLLNALCKAGNGVVQAVSVLLLPFLASKLTGNAVMETVQQRRVFEAAAVVFCSVLSALETRRNGGGKLASVGGLSPDVTEELILPLVHLADGLAPAAASGLLPLAFEAIATFVAARDLLPPLDASPSADLLLLLLARGSSSAVDDDAARVALGALANVSRVMPDLIVDVALRQGPARDALARSDRRATFLALLKDACLSGGAAAPEAVAEATVDALVVGANDNASVATRGAAIFGRNDAQARGPCEAVVDWAPLLSPAAAERLVGRLLESTGQAPGGCHTLDLPAGGAALCALLPLDAASAATLLAAAEEGGNDDDAIAARRRVAWLCAVAVADEGPLREHFASPLWLSRCVAAAASDDAGAVDLGLRALASLSNKVELDIPALRACVDASAPPPKARIAVEAAICKGQVAKGTDASVAFAGLRALITGEPSASRLPSPVASAYGLVFRPPAPSSASPMWQQRAFTTELGLLSTVPATAKAVALQCAGAMLTALPGEYVAPTVAATIGMLQVLVDPADAVARVHYAAALCAILQKGPQEIPLDDLQLLSVSLLADNGTLLALLLDASTDGAGAPLLLRETVLCALNVVASVAIVASSGSGGDDDAAVGVVTPDAQARELSSGARRSASAVGRWLTAALSDHKRVVRRAAAACRLQWQRVARTLPH